MKNKLSADHHFNSLRRFPQIRVSISGQLNHDQLQQLYNASSTRKESNDPTTTHAQTKYTSTSKTKSMNKMNSFKSSVLDKLDNHLLNIRNKNRNTYKKINTIHLDENEIPQCITSTDINFHLDRLLTQLTNVGFILEHQGERDIYDCGIREVLGFSTYSSYTINELSWQVEVNLGIKLKLEELTILHYLLFNKEK